MSGRIAGRGVVAQLVRASPCHGEGREFESRPSRPPAEAIASAIAGRLPAPNKMPRRKIRKQRVQKTQKSNSFQIKFSESYVSLILGFLVVLVASFLVFTFSKNKTYDRINTAVSTYKQLTNVQREESQQKTYTVKEGDDLWNIAQNVYGSGYNWVDLAKANNITNPDLINAGDKLVIPNVQKITVATVQTVQNNSPSITSSSYTVQKGDYLWEISVRAYGDGYKWPEIARANNIDNPDLIFSGNTLKLPR